MALKDVGKDEIRGAPNILKALHAILTSTDANVQTFVLRTLGFLAIRNDDFKVLSAAARTGIAIYTPYCG